MLGADEKLGGSLGLVLGHVDTLDISDGEELGTLDNEGAREGTADDKLG